MPKLVKKEKEGERSFLPHAIRAGSIAADFKANHIRVLDVRELTLIADCFMICSVSSEPQLKAVYNGIRDQMKEETGLRALNTEGELSANWVILDYGALIVHIFREEAREFYDLDGLWGDAPEIDLELDS